MKDKHLSSFLQPLKDTDETALPFVTSYPNGFYEDTILENNEGTFLIPGNLTDI